MSLGALAPDLVMKFAGDTASFPNQLARATSTSVSNVSHNTSDQRPYARWYRAKLAIVQTPNVRRAFVMVVASYISVSVRPAYKHLPVAGAHSVDHPSKTIFTKRLELPVMLTLRHGDLSSVVNVEPDDRPAPSMLPAW